ncbi:MAG: hypothetical protein ACOYJI_01410 [Anaerovoracaceae bacterium]|jgi:effector-binding domain-containing protein
MEIKEHQEFKIDHLFSFRGTVSQNELPAITNDMKEKIAAEGAEVKGLPISTTYSMQGGKADMEILIPVDKEIQDAENYKYKPVLKIANALTAYYKGNPSDIGQVYNAINQYIADNSLQPITTAYSVVTNVDPFAPANSETYVYVGINPNII